MKLTYQEQFFKMLVENIEWLSHAPQKQILFFFFGVITGRILYSCIMGW